MEKMALKKLTHSDLTFFKCYYSAQGENPSKQKALNLSSDILVGELYPELKKKNADEKLGVDLYIYGPGIKDAYILRRKILKSRGSKNWRLNGELVCSPEDDPERFDCLIPGDMALIGFTGEIYPAAVFIDFISSRCEDDEELYSMLAARVPAGMQRIKYEELKDITASLNLPSEHPVHRFMLDEDLASAIEGDSDAIMRVYTHSGVVMSSEELTEVNRLNSRIGSLGEELVSQYLSHLVADGTILDYEWTSRENAVAPFDFKVEEVDHSVKFVDVKSTTGDFERKIHISYPELKTMAQSAEEYNLYRVYQLTEDQCKLRVSGNMKSFARGLIDKLDSLLPGIFIDSISCSPQTLEDMFGEPITLTPERDE